MIVFGSAVTDPDQYDCCATPGIELVRENDSVVYAHQSARTLFHNYNLLLDLAAQHEDLEALVLLHQDAELIDPDFLAKARAVLRDPEVAVVGLAGAVGVRSIAWWEGAVTWASFTHRYQELGGGQFDSIAWNESTTPSIYRPGEVDSIDGFVMILSPWAVSNLRFDESLGKLHGYDFDFCCQVREAGRKVMTMDSRAVHHHSLELIKDRDTWIEAYIKLIEKWEGRVPINGQPVPDWRARTIRAEAEAGAALGEAVSQQLRSQALERRLEEIRESASWRMTSPLRRLKAGSRGGPDGGRRRRGR